MFGFLGYAFMQRAFITGILIALACSLLGVFLFLKRLSLIGDGLSHVSFGGIATGLFFGISPLISSLIFAIIGSIAIIRLKEKTMMQGDASIGIISYTGLGLGIFIASAANGFNVDLLGYLFGNILAISTTEMIMSVILSISVIALIALFYWDLFYMTFDEDTAKTSGIKVNFLNSLLIILTAITVVAAMRVVGLLLVSSLLVLPASSALIISKRFKSAIVLSCAFSVISVITGLMASYFFNFAASGTIVLVNFMFFMAAIIIRKVSEKR